MSELILCAQAAAFISESRPCANFYGADEMPVGQFSGPADADRLKGLVQFSDAQFLAPGRIARARLRLMLIRARPRAAILTARANAEAFDPESVTWMTRPAVRPRPQTDLLADASRAGEYLEVDVTPLLPGDSACFGLTLAARPGRDNAAVFSAAECAPPLLNLSLRDDPDPGRGVDIAGVFRQRQFHLTGRGQAFSPPVAMDDAQRVTVFAKNTGAGDLVFSLEISPDGEDFLGDPQSVSIASGQIAPLTPYLFARYLRARAANPAGASVDAAVTFQVQARAYRAQ